MKESINRIPSGFKTFDQTVGGFKPGSIVTLQSTQKNENHLVNLVRDLILKQGINIGNETLIYSLDCTAGIYASSLCSDKNKESLEKIINAPIYIWDKDKTKELTRNYFLEKIKSNLEKVSPKIIIIEGIDTLIPEALGDEESVNFVGTLKELIKDKETVIIIVDHDDRCSTINNCYDIINKLEISMNFYGIMQVRYVEDKQSTIIDSLYEAGCDSYGVSIIEAERRRQKVEEGFSPEHDRQHKNGELADAAATYAMTFKTAQKCINTNLSNDTIPPTWPFHPSWYKPTPDNRIRELAKAGAFIAAEIDRLLSEK